MKTTHPQKSDPLREKSFQLALRIIKLCKYLREVKKEYILSKQLLRAGTNPGAMIREAANAESGADFIHKLAVGQKETSETQYWLELLYQSDYLSETEFTSIYKNTSEVMALLKSSIKTKKKNLALKSISILVIISCTLFFLFS